MIQLQDEIFPCPNLLLIAGSGRKSGKTTLACAVINFFSSQFPLVGLKISPHFHQNKNVGDIIIDHKSFRIFRETSLSSNKDSSLMLAAGASQAYYIETTDQYLLVAFKKFLEFIQPDSPIVCESPALRKYSEPGIFLFMQGLDSTNPKADIRQIKQLADGIIELKEALAPRFLTSINFEKSGWSFIPE